MPSYSLYFWQRLTYNQKCILYRLVNNNIVHPKEKYLDRWWYSIDMSRREEILCDLLELTKNDKA